MNELNYATLPASKRLVEAGIVLETEAWWMLMLNGTFGLVHCSTEVMKDVVKQRPGSIPAPSMAEVWGELPELIDEYDLTCEKIFNGGMQAGYTTYDVSGLRWKVLLNNTNPTDALIDLLIWVRKEADHADK